MSEASRFTLREGQPSPGAISRVAEMARVDREAATRLVLRAGGRLKTALRLLQDPLAIVSEGVRVDGVVGLVELTPHLQLEIAPKFVGSGDRWREDFVFMAGLSRYGTLVPVSSARARLSRRAGSSIEALLASTLASMIAKNRRWPLRVYCTRTLASFDLVGDFDATDLLHPSEDGFVQAVDELTTRNEHNALIAVAADRLIRVAPDPLTRKVLQEFHVQAGRPRFSPDLVRSGHRRLPGHVRGWQAPLDLARDLLVGGRGGYEEVGVEAHGFALRGAEVWQDTVERVLRMSLPGNVLAPVQISLGVSRAVGRPEREVTANPDYLITSGSDGSRPIVIDAKYKLLGSSILQGDLYESLAFAGAAGAVRVLLVYPHDDEVGMVERRVEAKVQSINVTAVRIGTRGISMKGGLQRMADAIRREVLTSKT